MMLFCMETTQLVFNQLDHKPEQKHWNQNTKDENKFTTLPIKNKVKLAFKMILLKDQTPHNCHA